MLTKKEEKQCKRYAGDCTVSESFCAMRYFIAQGKESRRYGKSRADMAFEGKSRFGLCKDCPTGEKAYHKEGRYSYS